MSPISIDEAFLSSNPLPLHEEESDKQSRGRVLIVAGSREMPGAALLAACGALRAGAGILQVATCRSSAALWALRCPKRWWWDAKKPRLVAWLPLTLRD
jgi:ADP-dependent NAD(P)H-hydrate dehydratase